MEAAIIFAIVFVPFFLFVFLVWKEGKKMPESALAHLEKATYRVDPEKKLATQIFLELLLGVLAVMIIFTGIFIIAQKADPVYILPGIKESLAVIYMLIMVLPILAVGMSGFHNARIARNVVLDLDPPQGTIGWEWNGDRYDLKKEDFDRIDTVLRPGKLIEVVHEFILKNGKKLYLTLGHPGHEALTTMLKGVPLTVTEYYLPIVPVDVPPLLRVAKKAVDTAIRYSIAEIAVIAFLLLSVFAMYYYEKNQKNLDQLLPAVEVKVVGNQTGFSGRRREHYLWVHDGRFLQKMNVNREFYQASIGKGSARVYYNANTNRYVYKVTDFGLMHFLSGFLGISAIALAGRVVWVIRQKRRKQALR